MENTENKHDTKSDLPLKQDDPLPFQSAESKEGTKAAPMPNLNSSETENSESASGKDNDAIIAADDERIGCENTKAGLQKEPTESAPVDGNDETTSLKAKTADVSDTGASSSPAVNQTHQAPDNDVVVDCNEVKRGESTKAFYYEKTVNSVGKHQGPQLDDEKERPKDKQDGPPVPQGTMKPDTIEQTDGVPQQKMPTNGTSQTSQDASGYNDHGRSDRSAPSGSVLEQGMPTNGTSQTSQGSSGFSGFGRGYGSGPSFSASQRGMPHNTAADLEMLQQLMRHLGSGQLDGLLNNQDPSSRSTSHRNGDAPTTDSPSMQIKSYDKGGYSVVISNGTLCYSSEEKGVVEMESGTQFQIAVGNNNNFATEVDITFGGIFLGVWLLEAKQTLSTPLIVEGSSWAKGRLKFFSTSDKRRPTLNEEFGQRKDINGKIEFEFKPEASTLKLVVKHLWKKGTKEICIADFKTATVKDLKREIDKKYSCGVACLIMGGKILDEDKTMSSYALENDNEVIEVLYNKEELLIESSGNDSVTMTVDPLKVSVQDFKDFIAQKFNIGVNEQHLRFSGQNVHEIDPLSNIFLTTKEKPVIRVEKDVAVNNGSERGTTTEFGSGTTRGGGDPAFDSTGRTGFRGSPSVSSTSPTRDPGDAQFDGPGSLGKEGIAMLCGDEETVCHNFQLDNEEKKFSRKRAVTMIIQLMEKSDKATAPSPPSEPPKEPMSTANPPPEPK